MITYADAKDPSDVADYSMDWTAPLNGDTISAISSVTISPDTVPALLEPASPPRSNTNTSTKIWLQGGKAYSDYTIGIKVTTAGGRTLERSALLRVRER
jgi:hypothetical protein